MLLVHEEALNVAGVEPAAVTVLLDEPNVLHACLCHDRMHGYSQVCAYICIVMVVIRNANKLTTILAGRRWIAALLSFCMNLQ